MKIKYGNIGLRTAQLDDAETLMKWWNDGAVMEHAGFPNGIGKSLQDVQQNILHFRTEFAVLFIIEIDDIPVGEASYHIENDIAYSGWKICEPVYQNKGYGPTIIKMMFHHIFSREDKKVQVIRWDTILENQRAQRVYEEKIKARKIRVVENAFVDQLGRTRTAIEYELLKDEFYRYHNWENTSL